MASDQDPQRAEKRFKQEFPFYLFDSSDANASGGKDYIETVWGRGYVLRHPTDEEPVAVSA